VTYETILKVSNEDLSLRPGMTATADITVKQIRGAILIPGAALRFAPPAPQEKKSSAGLLASLLPRAPRLTPRSNISNGVKGQQKVWILKEGQPVAVEVTTGSVSGSLTEILSGDLQPGMPVIVDIVTGDQ
jgi:HlyD family secretion protein